MTDSNGRNSNDANRPMGIGTGTATPPGTSGSTGAGAGGAIGGAGAPKPRRSPPLKAGPTGAGPTATPRSTRASATASAKTTVRDEATKLKNEATGKARDFASQGKDKATTTLDSFAEMMNDAAGQVDERLGEQYGHYARSAADSVSGLASTLRRKDVDELLGDARDFVRKSPAIAIGAAAAVGFVLARLIKSGAALADEEAEAARDSRRPGFDDTSSI